MQLNTDSANKHRHSATKHRHSATEHRSATKHLHMQGKQTSKQSKPHTSTFVLALANFCATEQRLDNNTYYSLSLIFCHWTTLDKKRKTKKHFSLIITFADDSLWLNNSWQSTVKALTQLYYSFGKKSLESISGRRNTFKETEEAEQNCWTNRANHTAAKRSRLEKKARLEWFDAFDPQISPFKVQRGAWSARRKATLIDIDWCLLRLLLVMMPPLLLLTCCR